MSLANDKNSFLKALWTVNAAQGADTKRDGFLNVLGRINMAFGSGDKTISRIFGGEELPGTNYDSIARVGDEYWQVVFSSGTPSIARKFIYNGRGWEDYTYGVQIASLTLTTAQVKALNATPIDMIAAPGATKFIQLVDCMGFVDYNSAAYAEVAAGEDLTLKYTDDSGAVLTTLETTGWLDQTADSYQIGVPAAAQPVLNAKVVAHMATGEIITGDSPVTLVAHYRVIDVSLMFS